MAVQRLLYALDKMDFLLVVSRTAPPDFLGLVEQIMRCANILSPVLQQGKSGKRDGYKGMAGSENCSGLSKKLFAVRNLYASLSSTLLKSNFNQKES